MLIICRADIRPPTAPVLGTPSALSTSSISVPMTTPATDLAAVASYALERATTPAGTYSVVSAAATFPYTDSGLATATTYYYRARATDTSGNVGNYSAVVSAATQSGSVPGAVDLSSLPNGGTGAAANSTAYLALNVRAMGAGSVFNDPVTGVRTVKITSSSTPSSQHHFNVYSTLGLQIGGPWGANSDQYTIWFLSANNAAWFCDYQLGGTTSNYRSAPGGDGTVAFSRLNPQIMYVRTGSQLRRYNTATNSYADTGSFPYSWSGATIWLQLNDDETWATCLTGTSGTVTALNLSTGAVITATGQSGLDELYIGSGAYAFLNRGSSSRIWDLAANTTAAIPSLSANPPFHVASLRNNYFVWIDSNTGGGVYPICRVGADASFNKSTVATGYWNQVHCSGHWKNGSGTDQWFMLSTWSSGQSAWMRYNNIFYNIGTGATKVLGGHYSDAEQNGTRPSGVSNYQSQPHTTQSSDGKLALFSSNMRDGPRIDAFLMEVPRAA